MYRTLNALLEGGVPVNQCDERGIYPYELASNEPKITCSRARCEVLYTLIDWGATIPRERSRTPWLQKHIVARASALRSRVHTIRGLLSALRKKGVPRGVDMLVAKDATLWHRRAWRAWSGFSTTTVVSQRPL